MKFEVTDTQDALRELVADICAQHADPRACYDRDSIIDTDLWQTLSSAGVCGVGVPESFEGGGAGPIEMLLVAEELGRAVAAVPFAEHAAAAHALQLMGDDDQCKRYLIAIARGDIIAGIVTPDPANLNAVTAQPDGKQWRLRGRIPLVPNAAASQLIVVPAKVDDHLRWFVVTGPAVTPLPTIDPTRSAASVEFDHSVADLLVGEQEDARPVQLLMAMAAAEAVGVAAYALDKTSSYAKQRHQFGLPIGTFQAVKHRLADMLVEVENARSAVHGAGWALVDQDDPGRAVAMAQAVATENAAKIAASAIQLHGGIGMTWECDLHLYLRRAKTLQLIYGSPARHREYISASLLGG